MKEANILPSFIIHFLEFVASYRIFGIVPLDIIAHLSVSIIITIIVLRYKKNYAWVFGFLIVLGLAKEYYDSFSISANIFEHIKDMLINLTYPFICWSIDKIKQD